MYLSAVPDLKPCIIVYYTLTTVQDSCIYLPAVPDPNLV